MTLPTLIPAAGLGLPAYENVEALGAAALSQGRACVPLLRGVVIPSLPPMQRHLPERVIHLVEGRRLLEERSAVDLELLLDLLARTVGQGTTTILRSTDEMEGHSTELRTWVETLLTPEALRLAEVAVEVDTLHTLVRGVLDLVEAQAAVQRLWERRH